MIYRLADRIGHISVAACSNTDKRYVHSTYATKVNGKERELVPTSLTAPTFTKVLLPISYFLHIEDPRLLVKLDHVGHMQEPC